MTYDDRYNRNDRHEDDYQYQEYQDHQYEDDYDYPADKRQWLLVRALRALSGTVAAGIVVLTLVIIGSAYLGATADSGSGNNVDHRAHCGLGGCSRRADLVRPQAGYRGGCRIGGRARGGGAVVGDAVVGMTRWG